MIGKVLLLALACVAANEIPDVDNPNDIEAAFKDAAATFRKIGNLIHEAVGEYNTGSLEFSTVCEYYWGSVWDYANVELKTVRNVSEELMEVAKEQNSSDDVIVCLFERTLMTNKVLRIVPWTFDRRLQREADNYDNVHKEIVEKAYEYRSTYKDYYWNTIVKGLKECETNECLEEITTRYQDEYLDIRDEMEEVIWKLNANSRLFKKSAASMLSDIKGTLQFARITGINEVKECLAEQAEQ